MIYLIKCTKSLQPRFVLTAQTHNSRGEFRGLCFELLNKHDSSDGRSNIVGLLVFYGGVQKISKK